MILRSSIWKKEKYLNQCAKKVIFTVAILLILPLVIFFMTQNTRFEENIIKCISPKNIFSNYICSLGDNGFQYLLKKTITN